MRNILDDSPESNVHGHAGYVRTFVEKADLAGKDMLDVGCGFGWFELIGLDAGVHSITGVEPTDTDLATARRHIADKRVTFAVASADLLPFEDGSFDTIVMWEVLEHLPKGTERQAFSEIARVLRAGGRLYLSTPYAAPAARLLDPAWLLTGHRHYSREAVAELAAGAGLEVESLGLKGGWWHATAILNLYVSKWVFRRRPFLEKWLTQRVDEEWRRPGGFVHVFLRCRKND